VQNRRHTLVDCTLSYSICRSIQSYASLNVVELAKSWIVPTNSAAWQLVKEHNLYAFHREKDRDKVNPGDKAVFYVTKSSPPVIVGVFEFAGKWEEAKEPFWPNEKRENKVVHKWRFPLRCVRTGAIDARGLAKELSFVSKKASWQTFFMGSIANFGRPIPDSDYRQIFEKLCELPIEYQMKS